MKATYGDVTGEYLALRREAGAISGFHDLVWVTGEDAVSFLDGLLSQSIGELPVGGAARSLLLEPRGKLRALLWVLRDGNRVGLIADAGLGAVVVSDLTRFKLRVDADLTVDERPIVDVWGPEAEKRLAEAGLAVPSGSGWSEDGEQMVAAYPFSRVSLPRYIVAGADPDELADAGIRRCGAQAATAVRIEAGEPRAGADVDDRTIPQEAGVVASAVDFSKGCYLGQELVARIDSRGRVNRHLRGVVVGANVLPPVGAEVVRDDTVVGALTSVGESLELRAPVALALLRREAVPGDDVVIRWRGGSVAAVVRELPLDPDL